MKKIFLLTIGLLTLMFSCKNEPEGFTIEGTTTGISEGWILLQKSDNRKLITIDSTQLKDAKFSFKGSVSLPELYYLKVKDHDGAFPFFIENAAITVKLNADTIENTVVTGSASHDLLTNYRKAEDGFNSSMDMFYVNYTNARKINDTIAMKKAEKEYDSVQVSQKDFMKEFILKNGKSVVAAYLAYSNSYLFSYEEIKELNKAMDASIAEAEYVKKLNEREKILAGVQPGSQAPEFTMNDTSGKAVSLASYKGQIVLVDFWASWCSPCRAENPNVVKNFKMFKDKGFTVLGISLDDNKEKWIAAIKTDGLTWDHLSELKGWSNSAAEKYGVRSIPSNFLIDKEGKIIASNLKGEELTNKLKEILEK